MRIGLEVGSQSEGQAWGLVMLCLVVISDSIGRKLVLLFGWIWISTTTVQGRLFRRRFVTRLKGDSGGGLRSNARRLRDHVHFQGDIISCKLFTSDPASDRERERSDSSGEIPIVKFLSTSSTPPHHRPPQGIC